MLVISSYFLLIAESYLPCLSVRVALLIAIYADYIMFARPHDVDVHVSCSLFRMPLENGNLALLWQKELHFIRFVALCLEPLL